MQREKTSSGPDLISTLCKMSDWKEIGISKKAVKMRRCTTKTPQFPDVDTVKRMSVSNVSNILHHDVGLKKTNVKSILF